MTVFGYSFGWPPSITARLNGIVGLAFTAVAALAVASLHFCWTSVEAANRLRDTGAIGLTSTLEFETLLERHQRVLEILARDAGQPGRSVLAAAQLGRIERQMALTAAHRAAADQSDMRMLMPALTATTRTILDRARAGRVDLTELLLAYRKTAASLHAQARTERRQHMTRMSEEARSLARWASTLANVVLVTAVLALMLIGPVGWFLLRRVTERLRIITRSMVRLSRNDFSALPAHRQLKLADGPDEIGDLARALGIFRDNALALRDHRARLEQVNLWLDIALNNMQRGLAMFDADERLVLSNASYQRLYSLPHEYTMQGTSMLDILTCPPYVMASDAHAILAEYRAAIARGEPATYVRDRSDGRTYSVTLTPLDDGGWVTTHEDVTEERQADARARLLARQDALTELQNRRGFSECLEACANTLPADAMPVAPEDRFAVITIDLDHFKEVNDTHGHPVGDALLVAVADRLRSAVRQEDVVARMGGDEFAILQRNARSPVDPQGLAQRLLKVLAQPFEVRGHQFCIGGSIGTALAPDDGRTPEVLMQRADLALYGAKAAGRNTALAYDASLETPVRARRELERDLKAAVENSEFTLHYQPIVSLGARAVVGCEALLRWPARKDVSPLEFVSVAEEIGLICKLGAWVLAEACRTAATWQADIKVAVNLSPVQFIGGGLLEAVREALDRSGLSPQRLELEITETTLLQDNPATLATLHALRAMGVAIALDDFGTGYSSLSYLRAFPFDKLKIDRSFVQDLTERPECAAIVKAVATLAESLNMTTVAEGVETHDHLVRVHLAGCTAVQGYLFSRPVPAAELSEVFKTCSAKLAA
jgi:diguanylate cyclase (GGDEF)-like protein